MNVTPDDPALTAHALGELSEPKSAKIVQAIAQDESLAKEVDELSDLVALLGTTLGGERFSLGDDRREEIFKAGHRPDTDVLVLDHRRRARRQSFLAIAGVAAVVVLGFMGLSRMGADGPAGKSSGGGMADKTGPGKSGSATGQDPDISAAGIGQSEVLTGISNSVVSPVENPILPLAMNPASVELGKYEQALSSKQQPLPAELFAVEKWASLVQPKSAPQVGIGKVGVSAELGACPWDANKVLLMVNLTLDGEGAVRFDGRLNLNPDRVKLARVLANSREGEVERRLRSSQTMIYELEMIEGEDAIGSLSFETTGENTDGSLEKGYLPLTAPTGAASTDFLAAATFAEFARWGAQQDETELKAIAAKAAEILPQVSDEQMRYALDLILLTAERIGE